jgi:hypothetical protein
VVRTIREGDSSYPAAGQHVGSIPNSPADWITQQRLWQSTLARTSFAIAWSVLLRTLSPNFDFTMWNVVSAFDRWW